MEAKPPGAAQELPYKDEVYQIIGAAMEVANHLGCGFLEAVYQEALGLELAERDIPHIAQKPVVIRYKDKILTKEFKADFVCFGCIIVEIKAAKALTDIDAAQLLNYLKATRLPLGLLVNFGSRKLEWKRYVYTRTLDK